MIGIMLSADEERNLIGRVVCLICKGMSEVAVRPSDFEAWQAGKLSQEAFPYLTPGERDLLTTGICEKCNDKIHKEG